MGYRNLQQCVADLEKHKRLVRIETEVDPHLEVGMIQRRVYQAQGPALLFTNVKGTKFPLLGNLFGTLERTRFLFRDTLSDIQKLLALKTEPEKALRHFYRYLDLPKIAWRLKPSFRAFQSGGPVLKNKARISDLPRLVSWPRDGGAFITLPQVYTESPLNPGWVHSNLGMYRIQISGNQYRQDEEIGLHYQIHRGIGVHHQEALRHGKPFRVNIFVGGAPSMTVAAVMPLPEGMSELSFAGVLGGHAIPFLRRPDTLPLYAEADFCITGTVDSARLLPEGPFGDHLGYYSLAHDFPVLKVESVHHRPGAIWPFTTVGRPPQEDTSFGAFIHEISGPMIPEVVKGIKAVHAVDACGVHPLLLAIGSERYTPYQNTTEPQEILTQANALLGQGQLSLAKYLWIVNCQDDYGLDIHDIPAFFRHALERVDWRRDLHFQTRTTIDTLDYSGSGLNRGSKVVVAAAGPKKRDLAARISQIRLPSHFKNPKVALPGILIVESTAPVLALEGPPGEIAGFPLVVVVDDAEFTARTVDNFLWVTFTRSDPAADISGFGAFTETKHWGCHGSLVINARVKKTHAPVLEEDPRLVSKIEALGAPEAPLHGII